LFSANDGNPLTAASRVVTVSVRLKNHRGEMSIVLIYRPYHGLLVVMEISGSHCSRELGPFWRSFRVFHGII